MSKIFYDHLIILDEIDVAIKKTSKTPEEREELWNLIDQIIHHRVLSCLLDALPSNYHEEFLTKFHQSPHDESHLVYLNEKIEGNVEDLIKKEIESLSSEIFQDFDS